MAENKMAEFANMLGVELEENFLAFFDTGEMFGECKFTDAGFWLLGGELMANMNEGLYKLLTGELRIKKMPRKPHYGEGYWSYKKIDGSKTRLEIHEDYWYGDFIDKIMYKLGFCYKTKEEASANLSRAEDFFNNSDIINWEEQNNG